VGSGDEDMVVGKNKKPAGNRPDNRPERPSQHAAPGPKGAAGNNKSRVVGNMGMEDEDEMLSGEEMDVNSDEISDDEEDEEESADELMMTTKPGGGKRAPADDDDDLNFWWHYWTTTRSEDAIKLLHMFWRQHDTYCTVYV